MRGMSKCMPHSGTVVGILANTKANLCEFVRPVRFRSPRSPEPPPESRRTRTITGIGDMRQALLLVLSHLAKMICIRSQTTD